MDELNDENIKKFMSEINTPRTKETIQKQTDQWIEDLVNVQPMGKECEEAWKYLYEETKKGDLVLTFKLPEGSKPVKPCQCGIDC